jgi:hypothetical protein
MTIVLLQQSASKRGRVSSVCSEPSDSSLSLSNKLLEVKDPILGRLTGLGGFLTESVSLPSESRYCLQLLVIVES